MKRSIGRAADYLELTKPGITRLVVVTTAAGYYLGAQAGLDLWRLASTLVGVALVAGGTNALNEVWERDADARMRRTRRRPIPSGRLDPIHALVFSIAVSVFGIVQLMTTVSPAVAAIVAASLVSYIFVYTPLKKRTPLATVIGAVPGALPILAGWVAATGRAGLGAWALFAILFLWQLPHFLALGWIYRDDYRRGGFDLLSVRDVGGSRTARQSVLWTLGLIAASLLPWWLGIAGDFYLFAAVGLGLGFLVCCVRLAVTRTERAALRVFRASIAYLPLLLLVMVVDRLPV